MSWKKIDLEIYRKVFEKLGDDFKIFVHDPIIIKRVIKNEN